MIATEGLHRSAREQFDSGRFTEALELARDGLLLDEDHSGLLQVYGLAAYYLGESEDALEGLEGASLYAPLDPLSQIALADLYLRTGKRKSARAMLKFLVEPDRCPTPLLADLSQLLGKVGAYRTALKVCRRLLQLRPSYHPAHFGAAFYLAKLGKPDRAMIRHLRMAQELAPHERTYRISLAGAMASMGRCTEACDLIREVPAAAMACTDCIRRLQEAAEIIGDVELGQRLRDRRLAIRSNGNCCGS